MLLKKLEMVGFKSFADKTEFDFENGVTALVGPNGCGKSNVVDAVRWILGEQSAKAVRGTQMADVIFNGTATRRSQGYAEASLTFLNDRGILPSDYSEVCVTRRLYRSGESEYYLNRQPCRLRDIRQLFMDTGVGVDTYSIIEQGKVDRFIQANSKERRAIFEEAAGISRYKAQRKEAQSRLERARLNLQKVEIKLEEQRKQLRSIKYQAAKAKRYREHTARLREIVVSFSLKNYREWEARRAELEAHLAELDSRYAELTAELASAESLIRADEAALDQLERRRLERRDVLHGIQSKTQAAETSISHNRQRIQEFQGETERETREIWALEEKIRQTREQMVAAEENLNAIIETIQRQAEIIQGESQKADAAGQDCERIAASIEAWKNHTIQIIERATTLRNELNHMDASRRQQLARRARLEGQRQEKSSEAARLEEQVGQLAGRRDEISGRLADRSALLHENEASLSRLKQEADAVEAQLRDLRHRESQNLSRRDILQDIELRAEDVESGVKRLLRGDDLEVIGFNVQGMVADLIHADLRYAAAIESALGEAAQFVVTATENEAGSAIALLRAERGGRAGLLAMGRAADHEIPDAHLSAYPGVCGRAADLVRYKPELEPVVRHLLGDAWVVESLEAGLKICNNGAAGVRLVTLDGERIEPNGAIIGGEPLPRIGIISRKSELEAITAELAGLSGQLSAAEQARGRISENLQSTDADVAVLRKEIEKGNLEKLSNENDILNFRRRQKTLNEEVALIQGEIAEIEETVKGYDNRELALQQELAAAVNRRDQIQAEMESARRTLTEQQAVVDRLREDLTRLKVTLAEKEAQRGSLQESIAAGKRALNDIESRIQTSRGHIDELRGKQTQAEQEITEARQELERLAEESKALESELAAIQEEQTAVQARRAEHAERARTLRSSQEELQTEMQKQRLEEQELRVRIEGLIERVFAEQGIRLDEYALHAPPVSAETDWAAVQNEIDELREKIRRMGGVNEEAIDEETGLEISIVETERQRDDLTKATEELQDIIRKLNRVSREKFMKTFEEVRANFAETFRRLFGGGRCDLVLQQDETDVLEAGIEVLACPPGKELKAITLMSGGEKTMTTIALLFAIFRSKPSPFCILDEVDAALDESNIDRFTAMLSEYIRDSQFIIITHSKRTVGIADVLYGITMQEKGISRKVSVRVEDAVELNN